MGATDRLQQVTGAVEIDPVTLVEVGLRLAGGERPRRGGGSPPAGEPPQRRPLPVPPGRARRGRARPSSPQASQAPPRRTG